MRRMIAGLAAGVVLALGGVASADFEHPNYGGYDLNLNVNGSPFLGKWAIVNDKPYVGIEAFSDAVQIPRKHYYKAWSLDKEGAEEAGDPLVLMAKAQDKDLKTIRFAGVTMVDLYSAAAALDLPVHHNFRNKTIQVGSDYEGEYMKGAWYRYKSRVRGWRHWDDLERMRRVNRPRTQDRQWDDTAPYQHRL